MLNFEVKTFWNLKNVSVSILGDLWYKGFPSGLLCEDVLILYNNIYILILHEKNFLVFYLKTILVFYEKAFLVFYENAFWFSMGGPFWPSMKKPFCSIMAFYENTFGPSIEKRLTLYGRTCDLLWKTF